MNGINEEEEYNKLPVSSRKRKAAPDTNGNEDPPRPLKKMGRPKGVKNKNSIKRDEVVKYEEWNLAKLIFILKLKALTNYERAKLNEIHKKSLKSSLFMAKYQESAKEKKNERLISINGAQLFQKAIRKYCLGDNYLDIDVQNSAPELLTQRCEKYGYSPTMLREYVNRRDEHIKEVMDNFKVSRDTAKALFIRLMYGGGLTGWVNESGLYGTSPEDIVNRIPFIGLMIVGMKEMTKFLKSKYPDVFEETLKVYDKDGNPEASAVCHLYFQSEREVLNAMEKSLISLGLSPDILMHDGIMIKKDPSKLDTLEKKNFILKEVENNIFFATGYKVKLTFKSMELTPEEKDFINGDRDFSNALEVAEWLLSLKHPTVPPLKEMIKKISDERFYIYDEDAKYWKYFDSSHLVDPLQTMILRMYGPLMADDSFISQMKYFNDVVTFIKRILIIDINWEHTSQQSTLLKYNFIDGYLDLQSLEFIPDTLDENARGNRRMLGFTHCHNYEYPKHADDPIPCDDEKQVDDLLFKNPIYLDEKRKYFVLSLAQGIFGDIRKKIYFVLGDSNSGKGCLLIALRSACGDSVVGEFNGDNLCSSSGSDHERQMGNWLLNIYNCRIALSNELNLKASPNDKNPKSITNNTLKMISNGNCEQITLRPNHGQSFCTKILSTFFIFANDCPPIFDPDSGTETRVVKVELDRHAVDVVNNVETEFEGIEKDKFHKLIRTREFSDGLMCLLIRTYRDWARRGRKDEMSDDVKSITKEFIGKPDYELIFQTLFEWAPDLGKPVRLPLQDIVKAIGDHYPMYQISPKLIGQHMKSLGSTYDKHRKCYNFVRLKRIADENLDGNAKYGWYHPFTGEFNPRP